MLQDNLVVPVGFDIEKDPEGFPKSRDAEELLCKPLDTECSLCVVDSVPFYLRNVAYGDTIRTSADSSGYLEFAEIVRRGGYSVYRILLRTIDNKQEVVKKLLDLGALVEHDEKLIALAVRHTGTEDPVLDYVLEGKRLGLWGAQDGYVFQQGT